jgi:uncharacterized protein (TIGR02284 family)
MKTEVEAVKALATTLIDSGRGYEQAIKDDSDSELLPLFREMIALRQRDLEELRGVLTSLGEKPDEDGSFMSTVQRTVIGIRSALTGLGEGALPSFIRGEESVLSRYDDAIEACRDDSETAGILSRQRGLLQDKISKMKVMQAT